MSITFWINLQIQYLPMTFQPSLLHSSREVWRRAPYKVGEKQKKIKRKSEKLKNTVRSRIQRSTAIKV